MTDPFPPAAAIRVWDLPTRVFHAALAILVVAAIASAEAGGEWMAWHLRCGEAVLTLVAFRWAWGLVGGHWSRFAQFLPLPGPLVRHLRGRPSAADAPGVGHSPLGALSVWTFMILLTLQVATGLVADDEIATTGPLNARVDPRMARTASDWHAGWGAELLMALIALHVLAVGWYAWRRRDPLLRAMWTGDKPLPAATRASRDDPAARLYALAIWLVAAGALCALLRWAA